MKDAEVSIRQRYAALDLESKACVIKEKTAKDTLAVDENIMKSFSKVRITKPVGEIICLVAVHF